MSGVRASRPIVSATPLVDASATLTLTGNAAEGETVTVGTVVYTFTATVDAAYEVLIGAAATDSIDNLILAINAGSGAGTNYGTGTVQNSRVVAAAGAGDTMTLVPRGTGAATLPNVVLAEGITGTWNQTAMADGTFYAFEVPLLSHAGGLSMQLVWHDGTSAFTGTFEDTNQDDERAPVTSGDAKAWSTESGVTIPTVSASAAGSNMVHLSNVNSQRGRLKIVATAPTVLSLFIHQKE